MEQRSLFAIDDGLRRSDSLAHDKLTRAQARR